MSTLKVLKREREREREREMGTFLYPPTIVCKANE